MPKNKKQFSRGLRKTISGFVVAAFLLNTVLPTYAQSAFVLPVPGEMVHLSAVFTPPLLKAVKVNPDNPFAFNFIVDIGSSKMENSELQKESNKLIRYFLASLTTPEDDLWVNLSPYEKDRVVPNSFGVTEMGRDLLAQDYLLKQITATLMYPEEELGKKFWDTVYQKAYEKFGTTNIMANTFNKVWIIPEKAVVYENGMTAFVSETKLKVMLEEDYVALTKSSVIASASEAISSEKIAASASRPRNDRNTEIAASAPKTHPRNDMTEVVREIIIPELEKEVNSGKNFASLRQVYNSLILANWYKKRLRDSILTKIYVDKNKVSGVDIEDKAEAQRIYEQYLTAFKKGVYNYIKEDVDPVSKEMTPRKYFSGGMKLKFDARNATEIRRGMPPEAARGSSTLIEIDAKFDLSQKGTQVPAVSSSPAAVDWQDDPVLKDIQKRYLRVAWDEKIIDKKMFSSEKNTAGQYFLNSLLVRDQRDMTQGYRDLLRGITSFRTQVINGWELQDKDVRYLKAAEAHFRLVGQLFTEDERQQNRFPTTDLSQVFKVLNVNSLKELLDLLERLTLNSLIDQMADNISDGWGKLEVLKRLYGGETIYMELARYKARLAALTIEQQAASSTVGIPKAQVPHPDFKEVSAVTKKATALLDQLSFPYAKHKFLFTKGIAHKIENPSEDFPTKVLLPAFLDWVFEAAKSSGDLKDTKIVFLEAGAGPLYTAAKVVAKAQGNFPEDQLKAVWATMSNDRAVQADKEQGILFIKYLVDQGVLKNNAKNNLVVVDTDAGFDNLGTASIFARTVLNNDVLRRANERFGLNLQPFNEADGGNSIQFMYLHSEYERPDGAAIYKYHVAKEEFAPDAGAKIRISGFNGNKNVFNSYEISKLWRPIDLLGKTYAIGEKFVIDKNDQVSVVRKPAYKQFIDGQEITDQRTLDFVHGIEDMGLSMGLLEVLAARGYNVTAQANKLIEDLRFALLDGSSGFAASPLLIANAAAQPDIREVEARHARVQAVIQKYDYGILDHIDTIAGFYARGASIVHRVDDPVPLFDDQVFLPKFLDAAFDKAKSLGDKAATKMVFLDAGARPLYDAARLMAQAAGDFPVDNLKSIWATMGNYLAIRSDREQAILFIKFLVDQGVLTPETKHLLIVDTDTGQLSRNPRLQDSPIGTALIFAKTLLVDDIVAEANQRYGLNIKPFNVGEGGNTLDILYMYSDYNATPNEQAKQQRWEDHVRVSQISPEIAARLHLEGFNQGVAEGITNYIGDLWFPVDNFTKTENIADRFSIDEATGKVVVTPAPLYDQASDDVRELKLARAIEDAGLRIATLDVLEARGYDVMTLERTVLEDLETAYKNSGLLDEPADAAASSSLTPGGIDLKADKLKLDIRGDQSPVRFNFDTEQLQNLQFDGLVPVIIRITPVVNLPLFLTENTSPDQERQLSKVN